MKVSDIEQKLVRLQEQLQHHRDRPDLTARLEDLYWVEVGRLRGIKKYDLLPGYVSWLASYRSGAAPAGTKYLRTNERGRG